MLCLCSLGGMIGFLFVVAGGLQGEALTRGKDSGPETETGNCLLNENWESMCVGSSSSAYVSVRDRRRDT